MAENSTRLSGYAVAYYLITTILAIINGIIFTLIIKPGSITGSSKGDFVANVKVNQAKSDFGENNKKSVADGLLDIIRNCFPPNIVEAMIDQTTTYRACSD